VHLWQTHKVIFLASSNADKWLFRCTRTRNVSRVGSHCDWQGAYFKIWWCARLKREMSVMRHKYINIGFDNNLESCDRRRQRERVDLTWCNQHFATVNNIHKFMTTISHQFWHILHKRLAMPARICEIYLVNPLIQDEIVLRRYVAKQIDTHSLITREIFNPRNKHGLRVLNERRHRLQFRKCTQPLS
jgi:hypothetical protein